MAYASDPRRGDQVLFNNPYLKIIQDQNGYVRCRDRAGHVVAILPFLEKDGELLFGVRWEPKSAWGSDPNTEYMSAITGGVEENEDPFEAAKREFLEEAGVDADLEDFLPLGQCFGAKCLDTTYHLFGIDISGIGYLPKNGKTDGSTAEAQAHNELVDFQDLLDGGADAMLYVLVGKLRLAIDQVVEVEEGESGVVEETHEDLHPIEDGLARTTDDIPATMVPKEPLPPSDDIESTEHLPVPDGTYGGTQKGFIAVVDVEGLPMYVRMKIGVKSMNPVPVTLEFKDGWVTTVQEGV